MKFERGGTLLGFIIGVVFGLAAALAVAVYVTKVPIPFMNKGQSRSADQDLAESKKNKDWDPNAQLYGKSPAKPVPTVVPGAAAEPTSAPKAAKPESKADAKGENKPAVSADPLGDLAKAKTVSPEDGNFLYFVQVGAFRTSEDAESYKAKLSLSGVETKVSEREQSGRTVYRVRVGPIDKREEADRTKEKLDKSGLDTSLVRVQR